MSVHSSIKRSVMPGLGPLIRRVLKAFTLCFNVLFFATRPWLAFLQAPGAVRCNADDKAKYGTMTHREYYTLIRV